MSTKVVECPAGCGKILRFNEKSIKHITLHTTEGLKTTLEIIRKDIIQDPYGYPSGYFDRAGIRHPNELEAARILERSLALRGYSKIVSVNDNQDTDRQL